jgi:hypothetical protein
MKRETLLLLLAFAALGALSLSLMAGRLDAPGLYYDEVIQAVPAAEFLREGGRPQQIPGARDLRLAGGWFPWMTQPYMGALKSALLIPVFAVFGPSGETLRLTTLAWGLAALLPLLLWARELYSTPAAVTAAALLALDPSFLFVCRHDWGSVALALALRTTGLWLVTGGWLRGSRLALGVGGLCFGLGLFNKVDSATFLAAASLALLATAPPSWWRQLRAEPARAGALAAGLLLGAAPLLADLPRLWRAALAMASRPPVSSGDLAEKIGAWSATLDGSYFERLMLAGGSFERLQAVQGAASGPFPWLLAAAAIGLALRALVELRRGELQRPPAFALLATAICALLLLATPRAVRVHHVMNVYPLPQLLVAVALTDLWRRRARWVRPARALATVALAAALAGSLAVVLHTRATLRDGGGTGRWSDAVQRLAGELQPRETVVSLDWGFQAPLVFLRPELRLEEPVWSLLQARGRGRGATLHGGPGHLYLVQEPAYAVFDVGAALLAAARALPPQQVEVRLHRDSRGRPVFRSVRFASPHRLVYRGSFEVKLP